MMPGHPDSYLEQCIAALPPEKREAARHAFEEISETGDDTYLSKLLAVLEANGAYAKNIPKGMTDAGAKVVREMEDIASRLVGAEVRREASFKNTITAETARLANSLPVREINAGLGRQTDLLERLRKVTDKIGTGVSSGLVVVLLFCAFAVGVAAPVWVFWSPYHEAQQNKAFCDALDEAGIRMTIKPFASVSRLTVWGPDINASGNLYDDHHAPMGMFIDFDKPR
jgi:hypothetical protein